MCDYEQMMTEWMWENYESVGVNINEWTVRRWMSSWLVNELMNEWVRKWVNKWICEHEWVSKGKCEIKLWKLLNFLSFPDIVVFDNSYSWARWKKLHYNVEVHTVDDETELGIQQHMVQESTSAGTSTRLTAGRQSTQL